MKFSRTYASAPVYFFDSVPSPVPSDVALYDLAADPTEQNNLAGNGEFKEVRRRLDQRLYSWMRRTDDPLLSGPIATPYYLESLRELKRVGRSD